MYFSSAWIMADEHDQILSTEAEDELLTVETDPKEKTPTDVHPDPVFSMMQSVFTPATQTNKSSLNGVNTVPETK